LLRNVADTAPVRYEPRAPALVRAWLWLLALVEDSKTGKPNTKKIGEIVVGITLTAYIWNRHILGDYELGWELMGTYAAIILGWSTTNFWLKNRGNGAPPAEPPK